MIQIKKINNWLLPFNDIYAYDRFDMSKDTLVYLKNIQKKYEDEIEEYIGSNDMLQLKEKLEIFINYDLKKVIVLDIHIRDCIEEKNENEFFEKLNLVISDVLRINYIIEKCMENKSDI